MIKGYPRLMIVLQVIVTKVIGRVADELDPTIDKLVSWMENAVAHKENLSIQLTDLVVDFIRDDFDRWHMIQVAPGRCAYCHYQCLSSCMLCSILCR